MSRQWERYHRVRNSGGRPVIPRLPSGAVEDNGMVAEPVRGGWIAYHAITATLLHEADRDALAWGRGQTSAAALEDARRRGRREVEDPASPRYLRA